MIFPNSDIRVFMVEEDAQWIRKGDLKMGLLGFPHGEKLNPLQLH